MLPLDVSEIIYWMVMTSGPKPIFSSTRLLLSLPYGFETWTTHQKYLKTLECYQQQCLLKILYHLEGQKNEHQPSVNITSFKTMFICISSVGQDKDA